MHVTHSEPAKYRPHIDGLRAIAVLSVLFFHADLGFPGGYVGVDVFFVISGYLITGLILKDLDGGQFHILEFWERRVRRILPALAVVVLGCLVTGWCLFLPQSFKELGHSVVAQAMLVSNIFFSKDSGYFARAAELKPLLHTWSLAVEEQFYLFFPFLLLAVHRFSRPWLVPAIVLLGGASLGLSVYCSDLYPTVNFYFLPTRAWELLMGAFLAAIPTQRAPARWMTETLSGVGLLAIVSAVSFYDGQTRFPGIGAIPPCLGAALIIWANGHQLTFAGKLLAARPVVFIGLISYSLYLWHWPLLAFARYWKLGGTRGEIPLNQRLLLLSASILLAVLSWKWVETPFRKRLVLRSRPQVFAFACLSTTALLVAGLAISKFRGLPSRISPEVLRYAAGETDYAFLSQVGLKEALQGDFVELGAGDKQLPIDFLVWGDSHAWAVMPVFDALAKEHAVRGVAATHSQTVPLVGFESRGKLSMKEESIAFNQAVVDFIRQRHVSNVVLVAKWGSHAAEGETAALRRGLLDTISAFKNTGTKLWIMRQVPQHGDHPWNIPRALAAVVARGRDPNELGLPLADHLKAFRRQDHVFGRISAPDVAILDPTPFFVSSNNFCRVAAEGKALYFDESHLTIAGAMMLRPLFEPLFEGLDKNSKLSKPSGSGSH